jgi:hypothetical protein
MIPLSLFLFLGLFCCMASFPSPKVHRSSRRKLGRGQHVQQPAVVATPVATTDTVVITFSLPVIVNGNLNLNTSVGTLVSQVITSPTVVTQVYSVSVAAATWSIAGGDPTVQTFQGGQLAPASGTF